MKKICSIKLYCFLTLQNTNINIEYYIVSFAVNVVDKYLSSNLEFRRLRGFFSLIMLPFIMVIKNKVLFSTMIF